MMQSMTLKPSFVASALNTREWGGAPHTASAKAVGTSFRQATSSTCGLRSEKSFRCSKVVVNSTGNTESPAVVKELQELSKLDYYQYLEDAENDLVVVDFFTDWCGPCKIMYPKLLEMAEEFKDDGVRIVKLNCNRFNKELGSGLGVRVAPTFFLYKNGQKVADMTGAHVDKLRALIIANK